MRPIELTLDGFRSYHDPVTIRWEGRRLVGIVGPIGSGKTSLLDAISFALYAKTPRIERNVRDLVGQRRDEGKVSLTFEVDGVRWMAVRSLRRKGQPAHALYRMEGESAREVADRARDVTERVEALLGLDFAAFQRSVMLAQGEFDAFLRGTPAERDAALRGVFDLGRLDRMRAAAQARVTAASADLNALDELRAGLAEKQERLDTARSELPEVTTRAESLAALVPLVDEALAQEADHERAAAAARERLGLLASLADRIPDAGTVAGLLADARAAGAALDDAAKAEAAAADRLAAAELAHAEALEAAGGADGFQMAAALLAREESAAAAAEEAARHSADAAAAAEEARARADAAAAAVDDVGRAEDLARAAAVEAAAMAAELERVLHEVRHREMALTLRGELSAGDSCPVCEQTVAVVPASVAEPAVVEAERALEAARAGQRHADAAAAQAGADAAAARAGADAARTAAAAAEDASERAAARARSAGEQLSSVRHELTGLLGAGDPAARLANRRSAVDAAASEVAAAKAAETAARSAREAAALAAGRARSGIESLVPQLADVAGRLDVEVAISADYEALDAAVREVRAAWITATTSTEQAVAASEADAASARLRRAGLLEDAGLAADADAGRSAAEARDAAIRKAERIAVLEADLERLRDLEGRQEALVSTRDRLRRLFEDLSPARFPRYVLEERRRALSDLGGDLFERLSGGRYRFTPDGEFGVVDLGAAERVRPADTLSGGETFLGSLALALALAETVAREGGRLDAFFLDEGFGSLDAEHLDLAMEGVEQLVGMGDRLVVVVSHVAALRDRIDDLIVLDKDPVTGDTRVGSGGGSVV